MPVAWYDYSSVKDQLHEKYWLEVCLPAITDRAKSYGFYIPRPKRVVNPY